MGGEMKGREIGLDLRRNSLFPYLLLEDPNKMGDTDFSPILFSQPLGEIFIDPLPKNFVFPDLMIGFGESTTTGTAKGTERKTLFLGKGQVTGCHQKIGVVVDRFNGVTAATEFRDIRETNPQPFRHSSSGDLIIDSPDRNRTSQE
jgi:hypothetical protein